MTKDPACGMQVDERSAAGRAGREGRTYYLCSVACQERFEENPAEYAAKS